MCTGPLDGWYSAQRNENGKRVVTFRWSEALHDRPVTVPCGRCGECRRDKKRQWAMRSMHEASLHDENSFITLTYDAKYLPENGSLRKTDFSGFMKRLRSRHCGRTIRFFASGEYGELGRPHYHSLLFGS